MESTGSDFDRDGWRSTIASAVHAPDRLAAVEATGLLDTGADDGFDRLTALAAAVLDVPWSFVTLVDERRSFWKSCFGVGSADPAERQNPVGESFCQYVVATAEPLLIGDARLDERTSDNPSITSMGVVAWAGHPIVDAEGLVLGTFCVVDTRPRTWSEQDVVTLSTLAAAASSEIQLRVALHAAQATASQLEEQVQRQDELGRRSQLLAGLAAALSAADSSAEVGRVVSTMARELLSAIFVNIHLLDSSGAQFTVIHSPTIGPRLAERYATVAVDATTPAGSALVDGTPVSASSAEEYAARWPDVADDAASMGVMAASAWPLLRSDGRPLGALSIGWAGEVTFSPLVESVLSTLARMSAAALERSQVGDARTSFVRALHHALLPKLPTLPGLRVEACYVPANDDLGFGGDWYDAFRIDETTSVVIVGDVCGHGIEAAATMAQLRGSINAVARQSGRDIGDLFAQVESWLPDLPAFVATVAVHVIDTAADTIHHLSAGHPPSIVIAPDGTATMLDGGRRPVLGFGGEVASRSAPAVSPFVPGSVLVAYTDGLVERRDAPLDVATERLADELRQQVGSPLAAIAASLEQSIDWSPTDDVAVILVQRIAER